MNTGNSMCVRKRQGLHQSWSSRCEWSPGLSGGRRWDSAWAGADHRALASGRAHTLGASELHRAHPGQLGSHESCWCQILTPLGHRVAMWPLIRGGQEWRQGFQQGCQLLRLLTALVPTGRGRTRRRKCRRSQGAKLAAHGNQLNMIAESKSREEWYQVSGLTDRKNLVTTH